MLGIWSVVAPATLGLLLAVHMGGHCVVARLCRMHLRVGFGPIIFARTSRTTGTTLQVGLIPLGAFTELRRTKLGKEFDSSDPHAYPSRPLWQRVLMTLAGPAANYLAGCILAMGLYTCHGIEAPHWYGIGRVIPGYDAYGKLEPGDRLLEIDHVPLVLDQGPTLFERVRASRGAPIALTILRSGQTREVQVTPREDKDPDGKPAWRIGVTYESQNLVVSIGVLEAARRAFIGYPVEQTKRISKMLHGIVFGSENSDPGGPVRMVEELGRASSTGVVLALEMVIALSVLWGLLTLLPLPGFDGGRLVFQICEFVTRRRFNPRIEARVHKVGIFAFCVLVLLVNLWSLWPVV
jgi:regulator of sigma E protease